MCIYIYVYRVWFNKSITTYIYIYIYICTYTQLYAGKALPFGFCAGGAVSSAASSGTPKGAADSEAAQGLGF